MLHCALSNIIIVRARYYHRDNIHKYPLLRVTNKYMLDTLILLFIVLNNNNCESPLLAGTQTEFQCIIFYVSLAPLL